VAANCQEIDARRGHVNLLFTSVTRRVDRP
jgi:hypothetical protein